MQFIKELEQLFKDVEYLKERDKVLTHTIQELLTVVPDEVKGIVAGAKFLGVSESTLSNLIRDKTIPYKKTGRAISFSWKALLEYKEGKRLKRNPNLPSILNL
jgi:excisionase family DNA binding protein